MPNKSNLWLIQNRLWLKLLLANFVLGCSLLILGTTILRQVVSRWWLYFGSEQASIAEVGDQLSLEQARNMMLRHQVDSLEANRARSQSEHSLLTSIQDKVEGHHVTLRGYDLANPRARDTISGAQYRISLEGDFRQIAGLIVELERSPHRLAIESLAIESDAIGSDKLRAVLVVGLEDR